jgi:hypothetical protein
MSVLGCFSQTVIEEVITIGFAREDAQHLIVCTCAHGSLLLTSLLMNAAMVHLAFEGKGGVGIIDRGIPDGTQRSTGLSLCCTIEIAFVRGLSDPNEQPRLLKGKEVLL